MNPTSSPLSFNRVADGLENMAVTANIRNIRAQAVRGTAEHECRAQPGPGAGEHECRAA